MCVDDIFVIIDKDDMKNNYNLMNNAFKDTMKKKPKVGLPFLDSLVSRIDTDTLQAQVYQKLTHMHRILSYISNTCDQIRTESVQITWNESDNINRKQFCFFGSSMCYENKRISNLHCGEPC